MYVYQIIWKIKNEIIVLNKLVLLMMWSYENIIPYKCSSLEIAPS